jgi:hypothetical protein
MAHTNADGGKINPSLELKFITTATELNFRKNVRKNPEGRRK